MPTKTVCQATARTVGGAVSGTPSQSCFRNSSMSTTFRPNKTLSKRSSPSRLSGCLASEEAASRAVRSLGIAFIQLHAVVYIGVMLGPSSYGPFHYRVMRFFLKLCLRRPLALRFHD
eukprot:GHVN01055093.1.p1 GENE.GHVN01055093.1~~GHVN01055093.1.p1  ORF type:complete len:117 (-),score=5.80 GHVN01055093.1:437-787(-)